MFIRYTIAADKTRLRINKYNIFKIEQVQDFPTFIYLISIDKIDIRMEMNKLITLDTYYINYNSYGIRNNLYIHNILLTSDNIDYMEHIQIKIGKYTYYSVKDIVEQENLLHAIKVLSAFILYMNSYNVYAI